MRSHRPFLFLLSCMMMPLSVSAAPFCVQAQGLAPECSYFDAAQCRKRAKEMQGYCVANAGEMIITPGGTERYCLVTSSRQAQCVYADRPSCLKDEVPAAGVCIERSAESIQQDPYKLDINRTY